MVQRLRLVCLLLAGAFSAYAHNGPPYPMISDLRMGPCIVSLWTHPDVGTGTFFVVVNPVPGMQVPKDLKFEIGVMPVSGRLKERRYRTSPRDDNGQTHYYAWTPFDKQELWQVHLYMRSSAWSGEATGNVEVTPTGFGQWDLLFFLLPFLGIGFLWLIGMKRIRQRRLAQSAVSR